MLVVVLLLEMLWQMMMLVQQLMGMLIWQLLQLLSEQIMFVQLTLLISKLH